MTPANPDALADALDATATKALAEELFTYANQLTRMETQAGLGGKDLSVRVKEPGWLAALMRRAGSALQSRRFAALEADLQRVTAERDAAVNKANEEETSAVWDKAMRRIAENESARLRDRAAQLQAEVEALKGSVSSYSAALAAMKLGAACRRQAWKPGKTVRIVAPQAPALSYLALVYDDGWQAPWTPTRCDQLEDDWLIAQPEREAVDV